MSVTLGSTAFTLIVGADARASNRVREMKSSFAGEQCLRFVVSQTTLPDVMLTSAPPPLSISGANVRLARNGFPESL